MKFFLLFIICLLPHICLASLDEVILYSLDKKCAIRYLTKSPLKTQTIHTNNPCPDGWVQNYATVEINDSKNKISETLSGFFLDGYWLGAFPARGHVQDRANPQENTQTLTFILDTDKDAEITYLIQLRAQEENRTYGPFMGCPVFRFLVVIHDKQLFENEVFQEKIATNATNYAKRFCSQLDTIAVFGATQLNAQTSDIIFQMQIDPHTNEKIIIPMTTLSPKESTNQPIELRQQSAKTLLSVIPQKENILVKYGQLNTPTLVHPISDSQPIPLTSLNHLIVQSKLLKEPAVGRMIVHIQSLNLDGSAWVDLPQPALLKFHPKLKIGWAVIQGRLYQNQIQVSDIHFCKQEWCSDVS